MMHTLPDYMKEGIRNMQNTVGPTKFWTAKDLAKFMDKKRGTVSPWMFVATRINFVERIAQRPFKYRLVSRHSLAEHPILNIDEALGILADMDNHGIKRSNLQSLLRWIAAQLDVPSN